jgi:uncharacterized protein involved in outer membrane biogenesis
MKFHTKRALAVLALIAAAAVAVVSTISVVVHKRRAEVKQELTTLLGHDITFDSMTASLWGGVGFSVKEFRIADNPRFAATPFVHARELRLGMSIWHLLLGRFVINSLTFFQPEFQIITNEDGFLNVAALARRNQELTAFPRWRTSSTEKRSAPVNFLITRLKVIDGRVEFIDRSVSAPAEMQINNIELDVGGLDLTARARIKLTASLTEGLGRDVRIEGEMGPPALGKYWPQQPLNLEMQFDYLSLPTLSRAIPFLRDRIPRELDITGPMYLQAKVTGTLQHPHFTSITLKVPLLGSSQYNAVFEGTAKLAELGNWAEAPIAGKLALTDISLRQLRGLPLLRQNLPAAFTTEGSVNVQSRFEGSWNQLRMGILVEADDSDVRYPGWGHKSAGQPARLRAQILRQNGRFALLPSDLSLKNLNLIFSGALTQNPQPHLLLRLRTGQSSLKSLQQYMAPAAFDSFAGNVDWDLAFEKNLASPGSGWKTHGVVNLAQVTWRDKASGRKIDHLSGSLLFSGRRARARDLTFRLGSSAITVSLDIAEINPLSGRYTLQSGALNLTDVPSSIGGATGRMNNVVSTGAIAIENESPFLQGTLSSSEGTFQNTPYQNLQTDLAWSPNGVTFTDLRLGAFEGNLRAGGSWNLSASQTRGFRLAPRLENLSLSRVLSRLAPDLKDRFNGQLDFRGEFDAVVPPGETLLQTIKGSGTALIHNGMIKDFNLIARLFDHGSDQEQNTKAALRISKQLAAIAKQEDTVVQDFKATLTVEAQRIRLDNLLFSTTEYVITGMGWMEFDGATQGNGQLIFSPKVTQELQREYGALRYLVDRKGRLAVAFRVDGKLPDLRIRPENRALAQAFRWGTWRRGEDVTGDEGRKRKNWLPDSLEHLLHR